MPPIIAPGASTRGFTLAPHATDVAGAIASLREMVKERKNQNAVKALESLDGTDPVLYPILARVRPTIMRILRERDADLDALRRSPERKRLNPAAIEQEERDHATQTQALLEHAHREFAGQVEAIRESLWRKQHALAGRDVTPEEIAEAHAMADRLSRLDPAYGLGELTEWMTQIAEGTRSRGELVALIPILRSAFDHEGTAWTGNDQLLELIQLATGDADGQEWGEGGLCDGSWQASVVAARIERADRLATDLDLFLHLARDSQPTESEMSKKLRDLGFTNSMDGSPLPIVERPMLSERDDDGRFRLFPDDLAPPLRTAPEEIAAREEARTFRRVGVSAEQRAADEAARLAAGEGE